MIPLEEEPEEYFRETRVYEKCYFCPSKTKFWHKRTNNPVCPGCAKKHKVAELPNRFKNKKIKH